MNIQSIKSSTGPNGLKIDILTFYCEYCHEETQEFGRSIDEAKDRIARHFYNHEYPVWRQPSSIENDPPFEEYKSKLYYNIYENKN